MVFIWTAVEKMVTKVDDTSDYDLSFVALFVGTFLVSNAVNSFRKSRYINAYVREFVSDLAPAISIIALTALSYSVPTRSDEVRRAPVPALTGKDFFSTTTGRDWLVDGSAFSPKQILMCILPGFFVSLLFMVESNIGMLLTCRPEMKLRKGSPYLHSDMCLMGFLVIGCSLLGLPWCMVSLPHSPMHAVVLADTEEDEVGNAIILKSRESRIPGLISHIMMLALIGFGSSLVGWIPTGVAFGFLLYMGTASLEENELIERVKLFFTDPSMYPPFHFVRFVKLYTVRSVRMRPPSLPASRTRTPLTHPLPPPPRVSFFSTMQIHKFTLIQLGCFLFLWLLHDNFYCHELEELPFSIAMLFPVVLCLMVPFKLYVLPLLFKPFDLEMLTQVEADNIAKLVY